MKERKTNLLTIRITDDEKDSLDYLCDYLGRSKSDAMLRACKFFVNTDEVITESEKKDRTRKTSQVHLRISDSDAKEVYGRGEELGATTSQLVRKSIRYFEHYIKDRFSF